MDMMKQRVAIISLSSLLVFGILLGGQILYQRNWQDAGLMQQSEKIPGVVSVRTVNLNSGQQELDVVTKNVANLRQTALQLEQVAGNRPIRLLDQRSPQLENLLDQMEFALQEGIARGNFTAMAATAQGEAAKAGAKLDLAMDSDNIYLTLDQGNAQLVEVLERHGQGHFLPGEKAN